MNERDITAYHEAAHMVVAWELGLTVLEATIVPKEEEGYAGMARMPPEDRVRYADWVNEDGYLYAYLVGRYAASPHMRFLPASRCLVR